MTWRPTTAALAGLCLALSTATVPTGAAAAPSENQRVTDVNAHAALAGPPGTPPGVCPSGTGYGPPLPSSSMLATKIQSGFSFLEGPVWVADGGYLLMSDMAAGSGPYNVQPSTIRRFTPPATFDTFIANAGSNGLALSADAQQIIAAPTTSGTSPRTG
ncbi:SMP-30/gluconolactonase/LRE family protein [Micromonospora arborensis]|uniref:hypothetical protein n=1 Tax=Micromonospora arborensis TaxID=2116518 RepID=UPI003714FA42